MKDIQKKWSHELQEIVNDFVYGERDNNKIDFPDWMTGEKDTLKEKKINFRNDLYHAIDRYFDNAVLESARRIAGHLDKSIQLKEEEYRSVMNFLYWNPPLGGMPDSSLRIGVEFEVGGAYADWGFVVEKNGEKVAVGRGLLDTLQNARKKLKEDFAKKNIEKCACGNETYIYKQENDKRIPLCVNCFNQ